MPIGAGIWIDNVGKTICGYVLHGFAGSAQAFSGKTGDGSGPWSSVLMIVALGAGVSLGLSVGVCVNGVGVCVNGVAVGVGVRVLVGIGVAVAVRVGVRVIVGVLVPGVPGTGVGGVP